MKTKAVIFLPDGMADEPLKELGGKTPLEYAHTPGMDSIAGVGAAFVMVKTPELSADSVIEALNRGDYYPTLGVILEEISFENRRLRVKVKAEKGVNYKIRVYIQLLLGYPYTYLSAR